MQVVCCDLSSRYKGFKMDYNSKKGFTLSSKAQTSKAQRGAVMVEFFLSLSILTIFLLFIFDIGQRIGQLSWANQVTYIVSSLGSESNLEQRVYIQTNLVAQSKAVSDKYESENFRRPILRRTTNKTLIDSQNSFWKLSPYYGSTVDDSVRSKNQITEHTKVSGSSNGIWNPMISNRTGSEFNLYTSNNLNAILSDSYLTASNTQISNGYTSEYLKYDWCGRLCGGQENNPCPQSSEIGYTNAGIPTVSCS